MAKGKGGTGRGTDSKGWTRWKSSERKKAAKKGFNPSAGGNKGGEASISSSNNGNKPSSTAKIGIVSTRAKSKDLK
jgi:hypothetical protein